ncbi:MAG: nitrile hydratase subunit beta [Candidatus Binataceae bacterium]
MNGVHDMGGMHGFGSAAPEANEPVSHAEWEKRTFGLANLLLGRGLANVDEFRHAIERIPPARYLASSYYERWLEAVETLIVEKGILTRDQLANASGRAIRDVAPAALSRTDVASPGDSPSNPRARFRTGDRVRARNLNRIGHTRLPRYVRGKRGVILRDWGVFVFPDTNAHLLGAKPQHVYLVEFDARELWGAGAHRPVKVRIDLWEDYLEANRATRPSAVRAKRRSR